MLVVLGATLAPGTAAAQPEVLRARVAADTAPVDTAEVIAATTGLTRPAAQMLTRALATLRDGHRSEGVGFPLREVTAREAGTLLRLYERGHPTIVILYYASCPRSHIVLAYAQEAVARYTRLGLNVRAFAWGHGPEKFREYFDRLQLHHQPLLLRPWRAGELGAAMESAGVPLPGEFGSPYVAVLGGDGRALGGWNVPNVVELVKAAQGIESILSSMQ